MISFLDVLARLEAEATPGPWEQGDIWSWAGVMPDMYGDGRCGMCKRMGEPVWAGRADINGTRMLAHKHRNPEPYGPTHLLSGPDGLVAGNFDYEAGGIIEPADAAFIAAFRNAARLLIEVARAAEPFQALHDEDGEAPDDWAVILRGGDPGVLPGTATPSRVITVGDCRRLRSALAALRAETSKLPPNSSKDLERAETEGAAL